MKQGAVFSCYTADFSPKESQPAALLLIEMKMSVFNVEIDCIKEMTTDSKDTKETFNAEILISQPSVKNSPFFIAKTRDVSSDFCFLTKVAISYSRNLSSLLTY